MQSAGALVLAVGTLGGCGNDDGDELASLVPPDAPLYAEALVRPGGDQLDAIESLTDRVAGVEDPGAQIVSALDKELRADAPGVSYEEDVEPWLGDHAAIFVRSFERSAVRPEGDFAVLLEVTDADAAGDLVDRVAEEDPEPEVKRSYHGTDYLYAKDSGGFAVGVVDSSALVLGTEMAFKVAVDAAEGESLAASSEYDRGIDALPDEPLASAWVDPDTVVQAALANENLPRSEAGAIKSLFAGSLSDPVALGVSATADSASLDMDAAAEAPGAGEESPLLDSLPADSWLGAALPDLGPTLVGSFDRLTSSGLPGARMLGRRIRETTGLDLGHDVLDWLGDAAFFVQGTGVPGFSAGLIAQTSDPAAPRPLLAAVERLAERDSGLRSSGPPDGADAGFTIGVPGLGAGAEAGVAGRTLAAVIGTTLGQALDPDNTLGDDPRFAAARDILGADLAPLIYLHLPSFLRIAAQGGADRDPDFARFAPYAAKFDTLLVGSRTDDGLLIARATLSLAP